MTGLRSAARMNGRTGARKGPRLGRECARSPGERRLAGPRRDRVQPQPSRRHHRRPDPGQSHHRQHPTELIVVPARIATQRDVPPSTCPSTLALVNRPGFDKTVSERRQRLASTAATYRRPPQYHRRRPSPAPAGSRKTTRAPLYSPLVPPDAPRESPSPAYPQVKTSRKASQSMEANRLRPRATRGTLTGAEPREYCTALAKERTSSPNSPSMTRYSGSQPPARATSDWSRGRSARPPAGCCSSWTTRTECSTRPSPPGQRRSRR